ncbi:hypothetical protein [Nostoc sp. PA-18-2419]|nr:hypothetical protein [Nostoc sp. PA-18-2419]
MIASITTLTAIKINRSQELRTIQGQMSSTSQPEDVAKLGVAEFEYEI